MSESTSQVSIAVDEFGCAKALHCSVGKLRKDRLNDKIIPFYRIGKLIRYDLDRVRQALAAVEEGGAPRKTRAARS